jgi:hypothetical protein
MDKSHDTAAPSQGYETRDANVRGVYRFLLFLGVMLIGTAVLCWGMFRYFSKYQEAPAPVSPFADTRQLPLGPQLQVNPREDWMKYRQEQEQSLESYAWENRGAGITRVPIERAMELLLKKGLPVQGETPPPEPAKLESSGQTKQ